MPGPGAPQPFHPREPLMDPVTLAVLKGRLESIADEMDATLFRAAFNPTIAEAHDACHGIYEATSGATLVQGRSGLPIFVGVMAFATKAVIDKFPDATDGDVFIFNDPYLGGTHLSDIRLVRPYVRGNQVFCWLGSVGHWHDLGGPVPGNYNPAATEYFQEAVLIPPVRLYAAGTLRQDIVDIVLAASRLPQTAYGDLQAQLSALDLGAARMDALLDEYGAETVSHAMAELRARAAAGLRAALADLPDGTWSQDDFLDNDGQTDSPLRIAADITIAGQALTIDFTNSATACTGPVNISRATTVASVYVASSTSSPMSPPTPASSIPSPSSSPRARCSTPNAPRPPAATPRPSCASSTSSSAPSPGSVPATPSPTPTAPSTPSPSPGAARTALASSSSSSSAAATAAPRRRGPQPRQPPIATAIIPPVEILEAAYPVRYTQWSLRPGSGGAGQHPGGQGAIYEIELLAPTADAFVFAERARFAPKGVLGGGNGAMNVISYRQQGAWSKPPPLQQGHRHQAPGRRPHPP